MSYIVLSERPIFSTDMEAMKRTTAGFCEEWNRRHKQLLENDFVLHKSVKDLTQQLGDNAKTAKDYADATYQQSTGYTDQAIADLIGGAPELRNTLKELSDAIDENGDMAEALNAAIGKKANQAEVESWLGTKLDTTGDAKGNTVTFTSSDSETPSGWMHFGLLKSGETFKSLMEKISTVGRNLRWLYKMFGSTDISSIGDGTVTGALDVLNSNLQWKYKNTVTGSAPVALIPDATEYMLLVKGNNDPGHCFIFYFATNLVLTIGDGDYLICSGGSRGDEIVNNEKAKIQISSVGIKISEVYINRNNFTESSTMQVFYK